MSQEPILERAPRPLFEKNPDHSIFFNPPDGVRHMVLPPRIPCVSLKLSDLPQEDQEFLADNAVRSGAFKARAPQRAAQKERWIGNLIVNACMDGREGDILEPLGIEPGFGTELRLGGAMLGYPNGRLRKFFLSEVLRAHAEDRALLYLEVMHHSSNGPGCAAWKPKGGYEVAHAYSVGRAVRLNSVFLNSPDGEDAPPHIFFPIPVTTDTYTGARTFHGPNGKVDPMSFVQHDMGHGNRTIDPASLYEGDELLRVINLAFKKAFPLDSTLFAFVTVDRWDKVISQLADMCCANVMMVRERQKKGFDTDVDSHKETRVLVGRPWTLHREKDQQLVVSDFNVDPDVNTAATLGLGFALANRIARHVQDPAKYPDIEVPIYVSMGFSRGKIGDFGTANAHAEDLVYSLMGHFRELQMDLARRSAFRETVERNLKAAGINHEELQGELYKTVDRILHDPFERAVRIVEFMCDEETLELSPRRLLRWDGFDTHLLPSNA